MPAGRCVSKQFHAYARPKRFTVVFHGLNIFDRKAAQLGETPRKSARHIHLRKTRCARPRKTAQTLLFELQIRCSIRLSYGRFSYVKPTKTRERTRLQNLILHKSGRYYARAFAGGKEVWKSLKTSHFSVAEAKLAEFLKEHRKGNRKQPSGASHYSMASTWSSDALCVRCVVRRRASRDR
jgi:hypothetical protein